MKLTQAEVAGRLPDLPRWVEVRDLLLAGEGQMLGLEDGPALAFVLANPEDKAVFVVGRPADKAVRTAAGTAGPGASVIAPPEAAAWLAEALPEWTRKKIRLHTLAGTDGLPLVAADAVEFLDPQVIERLPLDDELRQELLSAAEYTPIAATLVAGQPVAFCYAGSQTETWWDISIDTLPAHRRRGYAGLCVATMIGHMGKQGLRPVWAAVEDNPASWRLALKLGFAAMDELALFER